MTQAREIVLRDRIVASADILHGKPRVANTRIQVSQVLDLLAAGKTVGEVLSDEYFPDLTVADIYACIAYASDVVATEDIIGVA